MRRNSLSRIALVGMLGLGGLGLGVAGCGSSNPEPAPLPSASASVPESVSPSLEAAPTMPPEAKGTTPAAAEAFVKHYLAVFSYAANTGDVSRLRKLGTPGCESCEGVISRIAGTYSAGGHSTGKGYEAKSVTALVDPTSPDEMVVRLTLIARSQQIYASPNATPSLVPQTRSKAIFRLNPRGKSWLVIDWTRA